MGFQENPEVTMLWMEVRNAELLIRRAKTMQLAADKAREDCIRFAREIDTDGEHQVVKYLNRVSSETQGFHLIGNSL